MVHDKKNPKHKILAGFEECVKIGSYYVKSRKAQPLKTIPSRIPEEEFVTEPYNEDLNFHVDLDGVWIMSPLPDCIFMHSSFFLIYRTGS